MRILMQGQFFDFDDQDVFLDNKCCIQALNREGNRLPGGGYAALVMTKKSIKQLEACCDRIPILNHPHSGNVNLEVFYYKERTDDLQCSDES